MSLDMVREERSATGNGSGGSSADVGSSAAEQEAEIRHAVTDLPGIPNGGSGSPGGHEHVALHLLPADGSLDEFRRYGSYMTLCGQRVPAHDLPDSECPPGCEGDPYCRKCTRVAAEVLGLVAEQLGVSR